MQETLPKLGDWSLRSACYKDGIPMDEYFRDPPSERAAAACEVCVVRASCLAYALEFTPKGYWAGTTERDRWRIRKAARLGAVTIDGSPPAD